MSESVRALGSWQADPVLIGTIAVAALAYLVAALRAPRWPRRRTVSFVLGLAVLFVALGSGIHAGDDRRLTLHMVEHLLIVVAAPPLLLLAAPLRLVLTTVPTPVGRRLSHALRGPVVRTLLHPVGAWAAFTAVVVGTHVPAFYDAALRHPALHGLEHGLYFWSAVALWQVVLAVPPLTARSPLVRMFILMAAAPPMILIGATLTGASGAVYETYAAVSPHASALSDQQYAGALMWVGGSLPMALVLVAVGWSAVTREEARAVARERYAQQHAAGGGGPA